MSGRRNGRAPPTARRSTGLRVPRSEAAAWVLLVLLPMLLLPRPGAAQVTLWDGAGASLELGGYGRTLSGLSHTGFQLPGQERTTAFSAQVLRLQWDLRIGESVVVRVHDLVQLQLSSAAAGQTLAGFGVSAIPGRTLDLRREFIERERIRGWHDVDRLAVTLYSDVGDVTVGRQAITWGISSLFPVADLWSRFSPFELDTEEKPGVDAVRWLSYPGSGWEVDVVVADRGSRDDLSFGVRGSRVLPWADLWVAGGKLWRQAMVMAGISAPVDSWKLRAEAVLPRDLDREAWERPRVTLGVDWLAGNLLATGEYHLNGIGSADPGGYLSVLADPRYQRGETYYLGRHYLGGLLSWAPGNDRLTLGLSGIVNLSDPSSAWTPVATYDLGQSARLSLGGVVTTGAPPRLEPDPTPASEYGSFGDVVFTRVSVYF